MEYRGAAWAYLIHMWLSQSDTEVLVVQYENLVVNLKEELLKILGFLNFEVSSAGLECAMRESQGIFKRSHHLNFSPYSKENIATINRYINQVMPILLKYNISYNFK